MSDAAGVTIDNLTVRFGERRLFDGFSLSVEPGRRVVLTGPSGCGKTTLLRCVLGFEVPDEGELRIDGEPLDRESVWRLRTKMAFVAQEPELGEGTVREVLERPFSYRANAEQADNLRRVPDLFDRFALDGGLLDNDIPKLSGGEKQRVAVIAAILLDRPLVLLDEASSALDERNKRLVADYFARDYAGTVLAVAHDREWRRFADREVALSEADHGGDS